MRFSQLSLYSNRLYDQGAKAMGEALMINGSLKTVRVASAHGRPSDLTARCVTHS